MLGFRKWPTQVARPLWPFAVATGITYYVVSTFQDMAVNSESFAQDPRNPYAQKIAAQKAHH